mgnify:FL=1|tara:strand:+ start:15102 stop:16529 length:1428 start_codon:yes stop_codon:yes gene_type:complete
MFESFVIMLREGVEAALVISITLVVLKRAGRKDLEKPVYWGLGLAVLASVVATFGLNALPINEEAYEGVLYWTAAVFVASMMWWMHRKSKTLRQDIEHRVERTVQADPSHRRLEAWGLGLFAFLMVFREGAESVMFLSAVRLTTDAVLSFLGALLGLVFAVVFAVMFVRGSIRVNLKRFFVVTEWVLAIFLAQLLVNGYHEFSEVGIVPATQTTMALIGPVVRNNALFILAIVAIPLFIWFTRETDEAAASEPTASTAERRLALATVRRERFYRVGALVCTLVVLLAVGVVYAQEQMPHEVPPPQMLTRKGAAVTVPLTALDDGQLYRYGLAVGDRVVRFLAMKTSDGKVRTSLDACEICGTFGYIQSGPNLLCLNCAAEINPLSVGMAGGCNPIPLESQVNDTELRIGTELLDRHAKLFDDRPMPEANCPICGMRVKINEAAAVVTEGNTTYYLCSMPRCRKLFEQEHANNPTE